MDELHLLPSNTRALIGWDCDWFVNVHLFWKVEWHAPDGTLMRGTFRDYPAALRYVQILKAKKHRGVSLYEYIAAGKPIPVAEATDAANQP